MWEFKEQTELPLWAWAGVNLWMLQSQLCVYYSISQLKPDIMGLNQGVKVKLVSMGQLAPAGRCSNYIIWMQKGCFSIDSPFAFRVYLLQLNMSCTQHKWQKSHYITVGDFPVTDNQINNDQASNTEDVTRSLGKHWIGSVVDTAKPSQVKCENEPIWDTQYQHLKRTGL